MNVRTPNKCPRVLEGFSRNYVFWKGRLTAAYHIILWQKRCHASDSHVCQSACYPVAGQRQIMLLTPFDLCFNFNSLTTVQRYIMFNQTLKAWKCSGRLNHCWFLVRIIDLHLPRPYRIPLLRPSGRFLPLPSPPSPLPSWLNSYQMLVNVWQSMNHGNQESMTRRSFLIALVSTYSPN